MAQYVQPNLGPNPPQNQASQQGPAGPKATTQPMGGGGYFQDMSRGTFGMGGNLTFDPKREGEFGAGVGRLPSAFHKWRGAARFAIPNAMQYTSQMQPVTDFYSGQMNEDWAKVLQGMASDQLETQFSEAGRKQQEGLTRAGYGGGSTVSPLASMALQNEAQARAGAFGPAAQQAVIHAQAMQSEAARNLQNAYSSLFQAWLAPSQLQTTATAKSPAGPVGPSLIGPGLNAAGGAMNMYSAMQS